MTCAVDLRILVLSISSSWLAVGARNSEGQDTLSSELSSPTWNFCIRGGIVCQDLPSRHLEKVCNSRFSYTQLAHILTSEKCVRQCTASYLQEKCDRWNLLNGPKTPPSENECFISFKGGITRLLAEDRKRRHPKMTEHKLKEWCADFSTFVEVYAKADNYLRPDVELLQAEGVVAAKWGELKEQARKQDLTALKATMATLERSMEAVEQIKENMSVDMDVCLKTPNMVSVLCKAYKDEYFCGGNPAGWSYDGMTCENTHFDPNAE